MTVRQTEWDTARAMAMLLSGPQRRMLLRIEEQETVPLQAIDGRTLRALVKRGLVRIVETTVTLTEEGRTQINGRRGGHERTTTKGVPHAPSPDRHA